MVYFLAVGGALANALTTIFQRLGLKDAPAEHSLRFSLIAYAMRRKVWLLGCLFLISGFLFQASALHFGRLTIVQPIATLELPFLVAILAFWFHQRISWVEWGGAIAATLGLATFLALAVPTGGNRVPGLAAWGIAAAALLGGTALTLALAQFGPPTWRAAMFGSAAAIMFAVTAAMIKQVTSDFHPHWYTFLTHWYVYAMVVTGLTAVFLAQSAYHAGPVTASQTSLVIVDPLVSMTIGLALFGDKIHTAGARGPFEVMALVALFAGACVVSTAPLIAHIKSEEPPSDGLSPLAARAPVTAAGTPGRTPARNGGAAPDRAPAFGGRIAGAKRRRRPDAAQTL
jgi:drug/metabolite transporter (DMT)-like permease